MPEQFRQRGTLLAELDIPQPPGAAVTTLEQALSTAQAIGYPVLVRPSYVLGGRAMQVIRTDDALGDYLLGTLPELVPHDVKARYPNDKTGQINTLLGNRNWYLPSWLNWLPDLRVEGGSDEPPADTYAKDDRIVLYLRHFLDLPEREARPVRA